VKRSDIVVGADLAGRTLAEALDAIDDGRGAVEEGRVFLDGKRAKNPAQTLALGARIVVHGARARVHRDLIVLFEDADIIVLDKSPGDHLNETETNAQPALVERIPGAHVVHRLDRDTSGVVVLAKNAIAAAELSAAFRDRKVQKTYLAIVEGSIPDGELTNPIGVDPRRPRARKVRSDGQTAHTTITTLGREHCLSAIRAVPHTGRTHQIRVHLAHHGAPILGDRTYGGPMVVRVGEEIVQVGRTMLHARRLSLPGWAEFSAPVPDDMRRFGLPLE